MEEKMVTLVCLQSNALAEEIQQLLAESGITSYLRNEYTNRIVGPMCDIGGVRIELAEGDLEAATELLQESGLPLAEPEATQVGRISHWGDNLPFLRHRPLEQRLWMITILLILGLGLLSVILYLLS
ncbi:putative signal transducing protein [Porphyromonas loveana]|uniref:putative signal transducing protein n=1 Tax=Porphyromonas loveana TaxID=1884669 RepID=UPI00359FD182